jgi:hypothetical protein
MSFLRARVGVVLIVGLLAACGPTDPLQVQTIQLGRSLNPDKTIAAHSTLFKPGESVYVSVLNTAPGAGTISVRWLYRGTLVNEASKQVSYREANATEFQLVSAAGFPPGDYSVEVLVDGRSVGSRNFKVE